MANFNLKAIGELRSELLYSPEEVRRRYIWRLESLVAELDPAESYPLSYIALTITGFPRFSPTMIFSGKQILPDLWHLLEELCKTTTDTVIGSVELILRLPEAARKCNVSLRTVHRWRRHGLLLRKFLFDDGKIYVAMRESVLRAFLKRSADSSSHARTFTRMSQAERKQIVDRARLLCDVQSMSFTAIVHQIASETGRACETIRYTLRLHDRWNPHNPVFPERPILDARKSEELLNLFKRGTAAADLARKFRLPDAAVENILRHLCRKDIQNCLLGYVPSPEFVNPEAEKTILAGPYIVPRTSRRRESDENAGANELLDMSEYPVLSREMEASMFRRYNFLKFRMSTLRDTINAGGCTLDLAAKFYAMQNVVEDIRQSLIRCNLRLVIAIARKHLGPVANLSDLSSIGNMALMRAVEKFDYTRGNKFSTYAGWAVSKQFARSVPEENYLLKTFITGQEEILRAARGEAEPTYDQFEWLAHVKKLVAAAVERLDERERRIILARFGMAGNQPMTLEELGQNLNLTRERIRQIEQAALDKLRAVLYPQITAIG